MSAPPDEERVRNMIEAIAREQAERVRRELESGELARLRTVMEEGFARLTASLTVMAEAQQRTEERLAALAARVDALAEAQQRTEERLAALTARVDALAEAQHRTQEQLVTLASRVDTLTARMEALAEAQRRTEERLQLLIGQQGNFLGTLLEIQFGQRAGAYLGRVLSGARALLPSDLQSSVQVHLTEQEWDDWLHTDWVVKGRLKDQPGQGAAEVYLVVEVSHVVDFADVERAMRRARYLTKAGLNARACVFGRHVNPEALELATRYDVWVFQDGHRMEG